MNNQVLNSFHEEVRKEAAIRPLVRARGLVKRIFAKRSGEKTLIKTLDSDTATLLKQNPNLSRKEVKGFRTQRKTQLQNMAKETAEETQQNILTSGKPAGAKGFIAKQGPAVAEELDPHQNRRRRAAPIPTVLSGAGLTNFYPFLAQRKGTQTF